MAQGPQECGNSSLHSPSAPAAQGTSTSVSEQSRTCLISPYKSIDEASLGFSLLSLVWVLSTLLINVVTTIQRQVVMADGKISQLTDKIKGGKIVFLSFLMHWSARLLQETLSSFTVSH